MSRKAVGSLPCLAWAVASSEFQGQKESGDLHVVKSFSDGVLAAVIDGLGHGADAASAASAAQETLEAHAHESVISLAKRCHENLRKTRGAVMSLASFNVLDPAMTWMGVGNVEGVFLRGDATGSQAKETLLLRGGVVGYQLPPLRAATIPVAPGDLLILATDGIRSGFSEGLAPTAPPQEIADHILALFGKKTDDALVLVVRYGGATP
ncbi:MAG: SpoIIE family protein phosphatase [Armatimonadetes bacterium]|nr:SpoIIE family protein phosphatase [Armatimonadota bacterium]